MSDQGYWVIRTYEAGAVGEKTKFWVQGARPERRSMRKERAALKKQEQNEYSTLKTLARLINANFSEGDWLLGLDYSDQGMERLEKYACAHPEIASETGDAEVDRLERIRQAAERELRLCLRRVVRELRKEGTELKYIAVTSDMDGDTGETVRIHHHLIINREARDAFVRKWNQLGHVDWSPLSAQADYTQVAEYLLRQVRRTVPKERKYVCSQSLIRPQPKDRIALSDAEVRVPKGGKLLWRSAYRPRQAQYIRYVLPGTRWSGGGGESK